MIVAEWLVIMLMISFSILCIGIGSIAMVISFNVLSDWRDNNGK